MLPFTSSACLLLRAKLLLVTRSLQVSETSILAPTKLLLFQLALALNLSLQRVLGTVYAQVSGCSRDGNKGQELSSCPGNGRTMLFSGEMHCRWERAAVLCTQCTVQKQPMLSH